MHTLKSLILSNHPLIVIETVEEERAEELIDNLCRTTNWGFFDWSLSTGLVNRKSDSVLTQPNSPFVSLQRLLDIQSNGVFLFRDFEKQLQEPIVARQFREVLQEFQTRPSCIVMTGDTVSLPSELESFATFFPLELPDSKELETVLHHTLNGLRARFKFDVDLTQNQKIELVRAMRGLTANQARQKLTYSIVEDGKLCSTDIEKLTNEKARILRDGGLLEYCPADDNNFELGGFDNLKKWLRRAAVGFTKEAAAMNLRPPRGIMLVGVQGCGKSLAAKAIARDWGLPLLKLDAGRLFDKFIGESERNLRKALALAGSLSPCVLWIDEIEKGFSTGGGDGTDGGTSKRLLATFLTWMQEKKEEVFLVGTANDLKALPPEFLRKGRFDETFFVDLPTAKERSIIVRIHLQLRNQNPEAFDIEAIVAETDGFSGAEIEQAVITSLYQSLHDRQPLATATLLQELRDTVPLSVSRHEDISRLRADALSRFVPVTSRAPASDGLIA